MDKDRKSNILPELRDQSREKVLQELNIKDEKLDITYEELVTKVDDIINKRSGMVPDNLTSPQQQAWLLFQKYDNDKNGFLTFNELYQLIRLEDLHLFGMDKKMNKKVSNQDIFDYFDINKDGSITLEEFFE